jgi:uncharacterized protein with PQ loop repeat
MSIEIWFNRFVWFSFDLPIISKKAKQLAFDFDVELKMSCECKRCPLVLKCTDDCGTAILNSKSKLPAVFKKRLESNGNIRIRLDVINKDDIKDKVNVETCHFFHSLNVGSSAFFGYLASFSGWAYLISWMIAFYPQVISNFNNRSVVGLNLDFVVLNATGELAFTVKQIRIQI